MSLVTLPIADELSAGRAIFRSVAVVLAFQPLACVHSAVRIRHRALTFLGAVDPLAFVAVTARIHLHPVPVLAAFDELPLVLISIGIRLLAVAAPIIVLKFAFEHSTLRVYLPATPVSLAFLPCA